ncbi:MAG: lysine--tRNA ligase [Hyphomicrobiaceae bacterium]|nr:lysine--tRNA ligase [Hyphomicrobiaceae bacterium]
MTAVSTLAFDPALVAAAGRSKAWPFEEAKKIVERLKRQPKDVVLFETGYGPSGLPHIGTFGEVARTTMVRHAFNVLTEGKIASKLLCFSDDMDGMRKVPDNVPNRDLLTANLGKPLTKVPDPFGEFESFGHHNNAMLRRFLDTFGFDYEFASSTDYYAEGQFDDMLLRMLERYDAVMEIMLPTLRDERRRTYAPFLPVHPETGVVMQVPIEERNPARGTIVWSDPETGKRFETSILSGGCKAQWKPDWALRWAALGVDYEMSGKDHIDNVKTSGKICRALGAEPPEGFNYELFLDDKGGKISKSKGNGLTIDEWLTYASPESLSLFMYREPKVAKKLYFDVIPRNVDEYYQFLDAYKRQSIDQQVSNPVWHMFSGNPPVVDVPVSFSMLLNLVSASNASNSQTLWGFITRYMAGVTAENHPELDRLVGYALRYFADFVHPQKTFKLPDETEKAALADLDGRLAALAADADAGVIQDAVYEVGKAFPAYQQVMKDGKTGVGQAWFNALYQVLLGEERGPRFGSFVALYGIAETRALIAKAVSGELAAEHEAYKLSIADRKGIAMSAA